MPVAVENTPAELFIGIPNSSALLLGKVTVDTAAAVSFVSFDTAPGTDPGEEGGAISMSDMPPVSMLLISTESSTTGELIIPALFIYQEVLIQSC